MYEDLKFPIAAGLSGMWYHRIHLARYVVKFGKRMQQWVMRIRTMMSVNWSS